MTTMQDKPAETPTLEEDLANGVHSLRIMDDSGDTRITWDPDVAFEVEHARKAFDEHKSNRYLAYKVQGDGSKGEVIREFDPQNRAMIMAPQHVGG